MLVSAHSPQRRSQLEGLLEVVPPSSSPAPPLKPYGIGTATPAPSATSGTSVSTVPDAASEEPVSARPTLTRSETEKARAANASYDTERRRNIDGLGVCGGNVDGDIDVEVEGSVRNGGGGDGSEGNGGKVGGLDEIMRRCSTIEVSLRASRKEALEARRARDAAESTVRQQKEDLTMLKQRVSELEASLEREQEASKVLFVLNCMSKCSLSCGSTDRELEYTRILLVLHVVPPMHLPVSFQCNQNSMTIASTLKMIKLRIGCG